MRWATLSRELSLLGLEVGAGEQRAAELEKRAQAPRQRRHRAEDVERRQAAEGLSRSWL